MRIVLILFGLAACGFGQITPGPSGGTTAQRIRHGAILPGVCNPNTGDVFFLTAAGPIGSLYQCSATNTWTEVGAGGGKRTIWGGAAAIFQAGVTATPFSLPAVNAPVATADADGTQAYLAFTANTAQTVYARAELPTDWAGTANLVLTAYSTSTDEPTIVVQVACVGLVATTNPTYGGAQAVSITPGEGSARTIVVKELTMTGCQSGNALYFKMVVTAAEDANLNVLSAKLTE